MARDARDVPLTSAELQAKIDGIGFGRFQIITLVFTGGLMFSEGSEVLVMGSITTLLQGHWELTALLRGSMVAIVFVGFACGNLISGTVGDNYGRRRAILWGYALIGICGFVTGISWHPAVMVGLRFGVGFGCGLGFPAVYALLAETCPTHLRGCISTSLVGFMPLGELFAALLVVLLDPNLSHSKQHCEVFNWYPNMLYPWECKWRSMCEISALPAFVFLLLSWFFLPESPHFLYGKGRYAEGAAVMVQMARMNGQPLGMVATVERLGPATTLTSEFSELALVGDYNYRAAISQLFTPTFFATTSFLGLAHFTKDFSVFGLNYVLPQYFHTLKTLSVGTHLTIMAILSFPGVFAALLLTRMTCIGHIKSMQLCAGLCAMFTIGMLEVSKGFVGAPCAFFTKAAAMAYFICTVVYTAEVFPTDIRTTAVGICMFFGRAGSISAPLLFELSHEHAQGSFDIFLGLLIFLMICIATFAPFFLKIETKGLSLGSASRSFSNLNMPNYGSVPKVGDSTKNIA